MSVIYSRSSGGLVKVSVASGGSGYSSPPSITVAGGGGTGATVVAVMAGTKVAGLQIKSQGSGFTSAPTMAFSGGGGTGAAATAYVQSGQKYLTFFRGRNGDSYGVDGMGRGLRWSGGTTAQPIGIHPPCVGPVLTQSSSSLFHVGGIQLINGGAGYNNPPSVVFTGGAPTVSAAAAAEIVNGRVATVRISDPGDGYQSTPSVSFSSGIGTSAAFTVNVAGGIARVRVISNGAGQIASARVATGGQGYAATPTVSLSGGGGTGAQAEAVLYNVVAGVSVSGGTGYSNAPTVSFSGGGGTGAAATCDLAGTAVGTVYMVSGGSGYTGAPSVSFSGGGGTGASGTASTDTRVGAVLITHAGSGYTASPSVTFSGGSPAHSASATAYTFSGASTGSVLQWHNTNGLTSQYARIVVSATTNLEGVVVTSAGTGCTQDGVTLSLRGADAVRLFDVDQFFSVSGVTVANSGVGYMTPPIISVLPAKQDATGGGAALTCSVDSTGRVTGVTVLAGGAYSTPPTATIMDTTARASATMRPMIRGKYRCCFRYLDDTPPDRGGPVPSSISDLSEVTVASGGGSITWTIDTTHADSRATRVELWRTTADQSVILFRVATLPIAGLTPYVDALSDGLLSSPSRDGYGLMPVTLPSGQLNARRFAVPPGEFQVACMFQDRAWYGVDSTGVRPNALLFSEIDEPESVPPENEMIIQENTGEPDKLAALVPLGPSLLLVQTSHLYRLSYVAQPAVDAAVVLGAYRGILNSRCWGVLGGSAFMVDSYGMYAYDGQSEEPVSVPIDNYWRDGVIDFSAADTFHVQVDAGARVVRFFYRQAGDTGTRRALCYCVATKAWWEETFTTAVTAGCCAELSGRNTPLYGTSAGTILKQSGSSDSGASIPYSYRSPELPLSSDGGSRSITVLYKPTTNDSSLSLDLSYNNSPTPRPNAIASDRGGGFVASSGGGATLNMKLTRSSLGQASGVARASYSGRQPDPQSSGGDRHMAAMLSGTASEPVVVRGISIDGVG